MKFLYGYNVAGMEGDANKKDNIISQLAAAIGVIR